MKIPIMKSFLIAGLLLFISMIQAQDKPNILWLTSEDHGPHMRCYGDAYATTPNVDALAKKGMIYKSCWSNAPVCAPARTVLISGLYANSSGGEHMRSMVPMPGSTKMYPQFLREAGYYCTNNFKEDYNLQKPGKVWDDSSNKAHYKNRPDGSPFFAIFNSTKSHESQLRKRPHTAIHDPAKVRVPAYHPDTPEVRRDWAQYYDTVTEADADAGVRLRELEAAGLTDDTIVFYYADHGSGMPRNKRWPYNSGLQVPLVVYIPEKWKHLRPPDYQAGGASNRLVSFVDFAPTLLSLAGLEPPTWMQGRAFLGRFQAAAPSYVFGFRGRMDERYDCVRSVSDGRYVYVRNFRPDKIYGQHIGYMWQTPTTRVWEAMFKQGKLNEAQAAFWQNKPVEELYDLQSDRDETNNLAALPQHQITLERMRAALRAHQLQIRDVGMLPEGEFHRRNAGSTPYDWAHGEALPFEEILAIAEFAASLKADAALQLKATLNHKDSAARYWAVLGLMMRGPNAVQSSREELVKALDDSSPDVKIAAAEALGRYGDKADLARVLPLLGSLANWKNNDVWTTMAALNAVGALQEKAAPLSAIINTLPDDGPAPDARFKEYPTRLLEELKERFRNSSLD
ncbi:MAG TPA: sulfatase-like hydrolase/transferase [Abditibacteriaceae bacterium]|jgi:uncharacterized sulfatase